MEELLDGPSVPPPPGVIPDLTAPDRLGHSGRISIGICLAIASLAVVVYIYTKIHVIRKVHLEDYFIVLAYLSFVSYSALSLLIASKGLPNTWDVPLRDLHSYLWLLHIVSILHGIATTCIKIPILLQYLRIFAPPTRWHIMYWGSYLIMWSNIIYYTLGTFLETFRCRPIQKAWYPLITTGSCLSYSVIILSAAAVNMISDFLIFVLPQHTIWHLQMSFKRRLQVSGIFAIGLVACIASSVRFYYAVGLANTHDILYDAVLVGIWVLPEMMCGILVSTLPSLPKFFGSLKSIKDSSIGSIMRSMFELQLHSHQTLDDEEAWNSRRTEVCEKRREERPGVSRIVLPTIEEGS